MEEKREREEGRKIECFSVYREFELNVNCSAIFELLFVNERESTDKVVVTHIAATPWNQCKNYTTRPHLRCKARFLSDCQYANTLNLFYFILLIFINTFVSIFSDKMIYDFNGLTSKLYISKEKNHMIISQIWFIYCKERLIYTIQLTRMLEIIFWIFC